MTRRQANRLLEKLKHVGAKKPDWNQFAEAVLLRATESDAPSARRRSRARRSET